MFECHIQGLGACMLTGHPHRPEDSFFISHLSNGAGGTFFRRRAHAAWIVPSLMMRVRSPTFAKL